METRVPVGDDAEHVRLRFTWYDSFRPSKKTEQASIHYEKASVLFNVGAVLTQMALAADRGSDAGLKEAARRFQARRGARAGPRPRPRCRQGVPGHTAPACWPRSRAVRSEGPRRQRARRRQEAAGMFGELRDNASLRVEAPRPVDIGPECAGMLERLCLAQAQEVTYEKARADKKNPALLPRCAPATAQPHRQPAGVYGNNDACMHGAHPCKCDSRRGRPAQAGQAGGGVLRRGGPHAGRLPAEPAL